jgi:hypothetical protein
VTVAYATRDDVYALGLPPQAFTARPRMVEAVDPVANVLTISQHGLNSADVLTFIVEGNLQPGAPAMVGAPALPSGLSASSVYYPLLIGSSSLFQVALSVGGAAVALGSAGTPKFGMRVDPGPKLDRLLLDASARVDQHLTNNEPPINVDPSTGLYPQILVGLVARMAARDAIVVFGIAHPDYAASAKALNDARAEDVSLLKAFLADMPIRPEPPGGDTTVRVEGAARAQRGRNPVGWGRAHL